MTKFKRFAALVLALILAVACCACSKKGESLKKWLNDEVSVAYDDGYMTSENNADAIAPSFSILIGASTYLNEIFDYIDNGTQPDNAEITEENGKYIYNSNFYKVTVEIDSKLPSVRIEMAEEYFGESKTEHITVITEKGGEYFVQQLLPDFGEYYEICFNSKGGSTVTIPDCYEMPYSIFEGDIPENFAKEN